MPKPSSRERQAHSLSQWRTSAIGIKQAALSNNAWTALIVAAVLISVGLFFGWYSNKVIPVNADSHSHYLQEPHNPLSYMSNWDGPDYLLIAKQSYSNFNNTNFFPAYPLLIRGLSHITGSRLDAALLISWVSLVGAVYFYIKILRKLYAVNIPDALPGLLLFILFPTAVFMLATYTEALFAVLALAALYFALQKKPWLSAAFLAVCTATHVTGAFAVVLVALVLWEQKESWKRIIGVAAIGCLGLLGYMVYLWEEFRQPLAFITTQKSHGWLSGGYLHSLLSATPLNVLFMLLLVAAVCYWWARRKSFAIYSLLFLLLPFVGREYGGFNRYALMAFPVPLMLYAYSRKRPIAYALILASLCIVWTFYLLHYAAGYIGG